MERISKCRFFIIVFGIYWLVTIFYMVMEHHIRASDTLLPPKAITSIVSTEELNISQLSSSQLIIPEIINTQKITSEIESSFNKRLNEDNEDDCFLMNDKTLINHCLPDYLLIGFPKCGSSSMWRYLKQHPQIRTYMNGTVKEAQFLWHQASKPNAPHKKGGLAITRRMKKYKSEFPLITSKERKEHGIILGEHSPGIVWRVPYKCATQVEGMKIFGCNGYDYLFSINATILNIKHFFPMHTRLLLTIRDPIKRSYSHYWHFHKILNRNITLSPLNFDEVARSQVSKLNACFSPTFHNNNHNISSRIEQLLPIHANIISEFNSQNNHQKPHHDEEIDMLDIKEIENILTRYTQNKDLFINSVHEGTYIHPYDVNNTNNIINKHKNEKKALLDNDSSSNHDDNDDIMASAACVWGAREGKLAPQMTSRTIALSLYSVFLSTWLHLIPNDIKNNKETRLIPRYCVITLEQLIPIKDVKQSHDLTYIMKSVEKCLGINPISSYPIDFSFKSSSPSPSSSSSSSQSVLLSKEYVDPPSSINRQGSIAPPMLKKTQDFLYHFFKPFNKQLISLNVLFDDLPLPDWLIFDD